MKLKLRTRNIEILKVVLSIVTPINKFITLRFSPDRLVVTLNNESEAFKEPRFWCKLLMKSIFEEIDIQSLREDTILLEINGESFLQTLKDFEKSNSDGLNLRLQRNDTQGTNASETRVGRTAILALFYSDIDLHSSTINHTFRIPVKILKNDDHGEAMKEPLISAVDFMINLPKEFGTIYKRVQRFKVTSNELMRIKVTDENGGNLSFILEKQANYKATLNWNHKLQIQRVQLNDLSSSQIQRAETSDQTSSSNTEKQNEKHSSSQVNIRLQDWNSSARLVNSCENVVMLICHDESCILHCRLNDSDDVEILYYINAVRSTHDSLE